MTARDCCVRKGRVCDTIHLLKNEDDSGIEEIQKIPKTVSPPVMETIHEEHEEIAVKEEEKASKMAEKKEEQKEVTAPEEKPADVLSVVNETNDLPLKESAESAEQYSRTQQREKKKSLIKYWCHSTRRRR